jgi:hypothetical protein
VHSDPGRPWVRQWNVNVERQLPADVVAHVGYVGQHGEHQPFRTNDANIVIPTVSADGRLQWPLPVNSGTRFNPSVGVINALAWIGRNTYHGLNVGVTRQSRGTRFGVSYTWSQSTDLSSSSTAGSNFNNSIVGPLLQVPTAMQGPSDFNITHNVVVNGLWQYEPAAAHRGVQSAQPTELLRSRQNVGAGLQRQLQSECEGWRALIHFDELAADPACCQTDMVTTITCGDART